MKRLIMAVIAGLLPIALVAAISASASAATGSEYTVFGGDAGPPVGNGNALQWAAQGYAGNFGSGVVGSVSVTYRALPGKPTCTFTPTSDSTFFLFTSSFGTSSDGGASLGNPGSSPYPPNSTWWSNSCGGTALIQVLDNSSTVGTRGAIDLLASNSLYTIDQYPTDNGWVPFQTGQAHVYDLDD